MSWKLKDEWIDLAQARHVAIFHNPDTSAEHHLIHEFKLDACPHCGVTKVNEKQEAIDFHEIKTATLKALNAHHRSLMAYRELHPNVRLASGPK